MPSNPDNTEYTIMVVRRTWLTCVLPMLFTLGLYYFVWRSNMLELTNQQVTLRSGFLQRNERAAALDKIQDITVKQSLFGMIFNYGDIIMETASSDEAEFVFRRAGRPVQFREALISAQAAAK